MDSKVNVVLGMDCLNVDCPGDDGDRSKCCMAFVELENGSYAVGAGLGDVGLDLQDYSQSCPKSYKEIRFYNNYSEALEAWDNYVLDRMNDGTSQKSDTTAKAVAPATPHEEEITIKCRACKKKLSVSKDHIDEMIKACKKDISCDDCDKHCHVVVVMACDKCKSVTMSNVADILFREYGAEAIGLK